MWNMRLKYFHWNYILVRFKKITGDTSDDTIIPVQVS